MPLREHVSHMLNAHLVHTRPELSKNTGINGVPLILSLKTLRIPESFPLDVIHLFYQGIIQRVLVPLFASKFWSNSLSANDGMKIPTPIWTRMGRELVVCKFNMHRVK